MQGNRKSPRCCSHQKSKHIFRKHQKKDLENHCLVRVPLLHLDSCHILLKSFNPPPPSQSPPANFHQLSYPIAFLLSTCNEASSWLMYTYLAHRLLCSAASVAEWPWEILSLIYHHLISEILLEIWFSLVCDFVRWFSSFLQLFTGP